MSIFKHSLVVLLAIMLLPIVSVNAATKKEGKFVLTDTKITVFDTKVRSDDKDDVKIKQENSYIETEINKKKMIKFEQLDSLVDTNEFCLYEIYCEIPNEVLGNTVSLKLSSSAEMYYKKSLISDKYIASAKVYIDEPGLSINNTGEYFEYFKDSKDRYLVQNIPSMDMMEDSKTVSIEMPSVKNKTKISIYFESSAGLVEWVYTYKDNFDESSLCDVKVSLVSNKNGKITVKVKKLSDDIKGYQIEIADNKKFKNAIFVKETKKTKSSFVINSDNIKYYIRVRSYRTVNSKKVYGYWSKVKTIK